MIFNNIEVYNVNGALRGMRNPMNSWNKSDSHHWFFENGGHEYIIGPEDLKLAQKLIKAGPEHRKFLRQIFVCYDLTAPLYWWKEFDTYKVATVTNSTSTMHKLSTTPITKNCFECDKYEDSFFDDVLIPYLENLRLKYLETSDKKYWRQLIQLLPESWLQTRTITMDFETLLAIKRQRSNHKLTEWSVDFMDFIKGLPYAKELLFCDEVD